jgi:hypothetical protein
VVDVFEQVEEELRSDRYKRLARTWLPVVGGVLLVTLIGALLWWGWQNWETSRAAKASLAYDRGLESLQANNTVGADTAFAVAAKEGNGAYKTMALMQRAGIALQTNKVTEAVALFDEAAKASRDPLLSDPAVYKAALLLMDTAPLADIEARLEPISKDGRPLRDFALEALAMARLQHGQVAPAREALVLLKNGLDTPEIISQRADVTIAAIDAGAATPTPGAAGRPAGPSTLAAILRAQAALPPSAAAAPAPAGPLAGQ